MNFTPGPWVVEPAAVGTVETESGIAIAQAFQVKPLRQDLKQKERQANARLIAAAPELLEQLTRLLGMCIRQADFNDDGDGLMFERVRAVIAKATGGAA